MTGGTRSREWGECKQGQGVAEGAEGGGFKGRGGLGQGMVEGRAVDGVEGGVAQGKAISLSWRNCLALCLPSGEGSTAPTRAKNKQCPCRKNIPTSRQWECVLSARVQQPLDPKIQQEQWFSVQGPQGRRDTSAESFFRPFQG